MHQTKEKEQWSGNIKEVETETAPTPQRGIPGSLCSPGLHTSCSVVFSSYSLYSHPHITQEPLRDCLLFNPMTPADTETTFILILNVSVQIRGNQTGAVCWLVELISETGTPPFEHPGQKMKTGGVRQELNQTEEGSPGWFHTERPTKFESTGLKGRARLDLNVSLACALHLARVT